MAYSHVIAGANLARPTVRRIGVADLKDALARGIDDFKAMPSHAVFLVLLYPVVGFIAARLALGYNVLPLLYPLVAGFALIGPFAAIGLYEMSRRREQGLDVNWRHALDVRHSPSFGAILTLGVMLMIVFLVWLAAAQAIYIGTFGYAPAASMPDFISQVLGTQTGWMLIIVGNGVGFLFALLVLTISVVSFPLLLDRDVGVADAVLTSVRAVMMNPVPMALWGLIVAALLAIGMLPLFFGLAVVMPMLGHATWHLFRKVVEPDPSVQHDFHPRPRGKRYAAEFPASLFGSSREQR